MKLKLIDGVIPEPVGGAHHDHEATAASFREHVLGQITELRALPTKQLLDQRYEKFRAFGEWNEA